MRKRSIHHIVVQLHSGLANFYYHKAAYKFGIDLVGIFIPIFFLTLGFSIVEVLLWFLAARVFQSVFLWMGVKIANRLEMRATFSLALLLTPLYFFLIWQIEQFAFLFYPSAFLWGFIAVIYWQQEGTLFLEVAKSKKAGIERGAVSSIQSSVALFAPFIGGIILILSGMPFLILLSACILLFSIIPLFFVKKAHFKISSPKKKHKRKPVNRKMMTKLLFRGFQAQYIDYFFPFLLFIIGLQIVEVGFAGTLLTVMGLLTPLLIGKLVDKRYELIMISAAIIGCIVWLFLLFFADKLLVFLLVLIIGITGEAQWLSATKRVCVSAKHHSASYFGTIFEFIDDLGHLFAAAAIFFSYLVAEIPGTIITLLAITLLFLVWELLFGKEQTR